MFVLKNSCANHLRQLVLSIFAVGLLLTSTTFNTASAAELKRTTPKGTNLNINKQIRANIKPSRRAKPRRKHQKTTKRPASKTKHSHNSRMATIRSYHGLHPRLRRLLGMVRRHYGRSLIISSGCRSYRGNQRVGGAKRSMHLRCMAADFKVRGISKENLRRYVSRLAGRGGVGTYCGRSIVHLDIGPRRSWHHGCGKRHRRKS